MKENNEKNLAEKEVNEGQSIEQEKRRKAVKNLLIAGGSAITVGQLGNTKWTKPVIESVVLPAHAVTSGPGFSITDPVSLQYSCLSDIEVLIDITGYISEPIAGIRVRLELTWSSTIGQTPTDTPPLIINVVTDSNGNYASTGNNIGYLLNSASVVASLPDYPEAGTDSDLVLL